MPTDPHPDSPLELARALWMRRKWLALLVFAAAFLAVASLGLALPDLYRATATVLVQQEVPDAVPGSEAGDLEPRLLVVTQEILSRSRLQGLIARFDLYPGLRKHASPEDVLERMRRDIRLERKESEQRWGRGGTVSFTLTYQGWDPQVVAQVTNQLAHFYVEENEKIRGRQAAGSQAAGTVDLIAPLRRQLAEMRSKFSDRYPDVIRLRAEIAALERQRWKDGVVPPPAAAGEASAAGGGDAAARAGDSRRSPASGPHGDQFRILDPAIAPSEPFAPNRLRLLVMGLVLAIGAAAFAVIVAEQLDTSFHRVDDLREFTRVPVLASIVRIDTRADLWRQRLRFCAAVALSGLALALIVRVSYGVGKTGEQLVWILAGPGGG